MIYKINLKNIINKIKNNFIHLLQIRKGFLKLVKEIRHIKEKK